MSATMTQKKSQAPSKHEQSKTVTIDCPLGATYLGEGRTAFNVWAPKATSLEVILTSQQNHVVPLERMDGYHRALASDVLPGTRYLLRFPDGRQWPDPVSRFQPEGVHKPSA